MKNKLKIAVIAHPFGQLGGPEIFESNLIDGLLKLNQNVTVFAPADWKTKAKLIPTITQSLWNMVDFKDQTKYERRNLFLRNQQEFIKYQDNFDIIHLNSHDYADSVLNLCKKQCVLTMHGSVEKREFDQILKNKNVHIVVVTKTHNISLLENVSEVISHGIPVNEIKPSFEDRKSYLLTIARITERKGIHNSIEIAKKSNKKLIIIGRVGNSDTRQTYFKEKVLPYIDNEKIIHIPSATREEIFEYLRNAEAFLFPITKPEVFGLVVAESLACGTPVLTTSIDPLPEILKGNKEISFSSNNLDELVKVAKNTKQFNRKKCRLFAEENFDNVTMAKKYLSLYNKILQ